MAVSTDRTALRNTLNGSPRRLDLDGSPGGVELPEFPFRTRKPPLSRRFRWALRRGTLIFEIKRFRQLVSQLFSGGVL